MFQCHPGGPSGTLSLLTYSQSWSGWAGCCCWAAAPCGSLRMVCMMSWLSSSPSSGRLPISWSVSIPPWAGWLPSVRVVSRSAVSMFSSPMSSGMLPRLKLLPIPRPLSALSCLLWVSWLLARKGSMLVVPSLRLCLIIISWAWLMATFSWLEERGLT